MSMLADMEKIIIFQAVTNPSPTSNGQAFLCQ